MDKEGSGGSQQEIRSELAEFILLTLKAATHHVLFLRQVYPARSFRKERVLGTFIQACRFPEIRAYITQLFDSTREELLKGNVAAYCVALHREGEQPHELVMMQPEMLTSDRSPWTLGSWNAAEGMLRACLIRLHHAHHALPATTDGCTFHVFVQTKNRGGLDSQQWLMHSTGPLDSSGRPTPSLHVSTTQQVSQSSQHDGSAHTGSLGSQRGAPGGSLDEGTPPAAEREEPGLGRESHFFGDLGLPSTGVPQQIPVFSGRDGLSVPSDTSHQRSPASLLQDMTLKPLADECVPGIAALTFSVLFTK